ncbi:MAG: hypothetical protein ACRDKD_09845, partial [Solirubrobacteraceae bacterium]
MQDRLGNSQDGELPMHPTDSWERAEVNRLLGPPLLSLPRQRREHLLVVLRWLDLPEDVGDLAVS